LYFLIVALDVAKIILIFSLSTNYYYADLKHKDEALKLLLGVAVPIFFEVSKRISDKQKDKIESKASNDKP